MKIERKKSLICEKYCDDGDSWPDCDGWCPSPTTIRMKKLMEKHIREYHS